MRNGLSVPLIEEACRTLLSRRRRVGVRDVMAYLRDQYGIAGRTERVAKILSQIEAESAVTPSNLSTPVPIELTDLQRQLRVSEARALRAEDLERHHQDFWAARYDEKVQEIEKRYAALHAQNTALTSEQYLRARQLAVELARRLAKYEKVEALP
jgi:hypothetical protein